MARLVCIIFGFLAMVLVQGAAAQAVHVVGDSLGWIVPIDGAAVYTNWTNGKTFMVGDGLVFNFVTNNHDVLLVEKSSFDACTSTNAIGDIITVGPANVNLTSAGEHYYICTIGRHCQAGQKLAVTVSATPGATPPSPITVSATPGATPPSTIKSSQNKWLKWLIIGAGLALAALSLCFLLIWRSRDKVVEYLHSTKKANTEQEVLLHDLGIHRRQNNSSHERNSHELHFFSFESIVSATSNFAPTNKLGEGGFGPVYKGQFPDGQEVAIKRLSTNSRQGLVELKNEVKVIAKLQHNNLVRLLGCCIEREEKLLIYEYMPNKSLDFFLFDPLNKSALDWKTRFNIIEGIAQGLLYLHKYSRLKIIHRDLKASNVLLDSGMNPKISDFGLAKIFGSDESKANTDRVVGTVGYMAPEYAYEGIFSTKSDVFSFGVLLLEITSGRRNNSFQYTDGSLNLVMHAWELWNQGRASEMIDSTILDEFQNEVLRCIHIGLLCTQENPTDRPTMLDVASMLYNDSYQLPSPQKPAFYGRRNRQDAEIAEQKPDRWSVNEASMTEMEAR